MNIMTRGVKAVYNFLVGDMRLLIGTLVALVLTAVVAPLSPVAAGALLVVVVVLTLGASLRRETMP
jgi:tryptophan-rich sensory protein